jgi:hypothetical protein
MLAQSYTPNTPDTSSCQIYGGYNINLQKCLYFTFSSPTLLETSRIRQDLALKVVLHVAADSTRSKHAPAGHRTLMTEVALLNGATNFLLLTVV